VRLASPYRQSLDAIRRIPIAAPDPTGGGAPVPVALADVADVGLVSGASFIYREEQQRYVPIKFSVRGRDLGGAVHLAHHDLKVHLGDQEICASSICFRASGALEQTNKSNC
jgi:cobalt-zinc-cadmium resistance protein CzcA